MKKFYRLHDGTVVCREPACSQPTMATLILAHGAGAGMDSEFMVELSRLLVERHIEVIRFNFPYMARIVESGVRRPPNRMEALVSSFGRVVDLVSKERRSQPLFIGGKSMGGRVATHLAELKPSVCKGVVAFGYPFHPPGKPHRLRTEHFSKLSNPIKILQGDRDKFGVPGEVEGYGLPSSVQLSWIISGDHDFRPLKRSGRTWLQNMHEAAELAHCFIVHASEQTHVIA
jgi:predicted alpha/beta-hydrolase family hydrolase